MKRDKRLMRFWTLDFGLWSRRSARRQSKIQNPKSKIGSAFLLTILTLSLATSNSLLSPQSSALTSTAYASNAAVPSGDASDTSPQAISKPQRVDMYFRDRNEPSVWEMLGFDLPETAEESDVPGYVGYVPKVHMTPEQYALAKAHGIRVRVVGDVPPSTPDWDPACYRNYDQMVTYLNGVVSRFPNLAEVTDIGDSWCKAHPGQCPAPHAGNGYDIWRIKITNRSLTGPKPRFHLVAAHHAREIATPELAMQWVEELVTGYGVNADITWLLDNREIYVVPVENPDGWYHAYTDQVYWRKNDDNRSGACAYPDTGVDPNRNYDICWGCPGASSSSCSGTFYGYGPNSEDETQAMVNEYTAVQPDAMISLHTVGPYVLYPWGNSGYGAPPDRAGLDAFAWNMARINNNTPRTRVGQPYNVLYNVSGTTDDYVYSRHWVPSFTIELGGYSDFNAPCTALPGMMNTYKPVLTYAVKVTSAITQTSYMHAFGPTPNNVVAGVSGTTLNASAVISANYGTTNGAIYSIDLLPEDGNGTPMTLNGQNATASIDISGLPVGRHTLYVQGKAAYSYNGNPDQWGVVTAVFFNAPGPQPTSTSTPTAVPPSMTPVPPTSTVPPTHTMPPVPPTSTSTSTSTSIAASPTPQHRICRVQFNDVPPDSPFYRGVMCLACLYDVVGYDDGTFRPNNHVTRGQLAKIVSNAIDYEDQIPENKQTFQDVPASHVFWLYIERLVLHNVMGGYACGGPGEPCVNNRPYFRPHAFATRAQTSKIVSNAAGYNEIPTAQTFQDVPPTHPFYMEIQRLASRGIMGGYECGGPGEPCLPPGNRPYFRGYNNVTRGQAAKIAANTFLPDCDPPR